ncbi:bifunctional D-altronate/D-mannonate dehydratase, partial [Bacillus licheniformis]
GYPAVRVQTGVPGLQRVYGVHDGTAIAAEADGQRIDQRVLPVEEDWDTAGYLRHVPEVLAAVRSEFGPELPLLHDAHHRLSPQEAARLARTVEPFDLFWL